MKVAAGSLIGMDPSSHLIAQRALKGVNPDCVVMTFKTLKEAVESDSVAGEELVVLGNPDLATFNRAVEARDKLGLRRWAVVVLGKPFRAHEAEFLSAEEFDESTFLRAVRSASVQHRLVRQNEQLRGDLLSIATRISHDLRTPLGGILSAGEVMKEVVTEIDPSKAVLARPLFNSVDELGRLIGRVSQVAKASVNPVIKQSVDVKDVVWSVLQRQHRHIVQRGAQLIEPDSWPEVEAVAAWLEVIWESLISNSLASEKPGLRIELGWSKNPHEYRFSVTDNGVGVPAEKVGSLFQPFHQLHRPNARQGIGLSIVQRLSELQGGHCGYEPVASGGSRFFFTLPTGDFSRA